MADPETRVDKLRRIIIAKKIDAMLVTSISNVRYLSGFTGSSAFVLVTRSDQFFFTDSRYIEQSGYEVRGFEIGLESGDRANVICDLVKKLCVRRLGFESRVSYDFYLKLSKLPVRLFPQQSLVEDMRLVKDDHEIYCIKKAIRRAEEAFLATKPFIKTGAKESAIALRLEMELRKRGCRRIPFDIIVASGRNSSLPHAGQTDKKIQRGDFVIIDWGGEADGYYSDMTRTLLIEGADLERKKNIYRIVNGAREKALKAVSEGLDSTQIDAVARSFITDCGYGDCFGHGLGHGVGLEVHEAPRISWLGGQKLVNGMVFTIEPGIYVSGLGGVRIEDMTLVAGAGRPLTSLSRKLEIIKA